MVRWLTRRLHGESRLLERPFSMAMVFIGPAAVALMVCVLIAAMGVDLGLNLTIVGLVLALLLPLAVEIRNRTGRRRKILVLDYRSHQFGHAVSRGVTRTLAKDRRQWEVEYQSTGTASSEGAVQWQVRQLQTAVVNDVDGLVLIPSGDDDDLWYALAAVIKTGAFVVAVDTKPPHMVFTEIGTDAPRFVSTRYAKTGSLVGQVIAEFLTDIPDSSAILWTGPTGSWPGEERSRNVVYALAEQQLLGRATLMRLSSWTPEAKRCRETLARVDAAPGRVAIYCADDENAMALHLLCMTERPELRQKMYIIGCNGTADDWGNIQAIDQRAVDVTVEILAEEQGAQAALMMIKERSGRLSPSERSTYIAPRLLYRTYSANRWIDSLFEEEHDVTQTSSQAHHLAQQEAERSLNPREARAMVVESSLDEAMEEVGPLSTVDDTLLHS